MQTFDARDINLTLDKTELKSLYQINSYRHGAAILFNWGIILLSIFICIQFFNPFLYLLAILVIGARMHALAILMHDASHYRFLKNKKWNDIVTNLSTMYLLFSSIENYRKNHLTHHRNLNTEEDPDWFAKLGKKEFQFPQTKKEFLLTLLSYFSLYQGISDAIWIFGRINGSKNNTKNKSKFTQELAIKLGFYLALVIALTASGIWIPFLIYWVVPYFSTFFMFQYIRSVAEHFGELEYDHLLSSTRTIVKLNPIEKFFFSPHNVGYHLEHHLYPGVPFYNLPRLHNQLMATPEYAEKAHLTPGFLNGLLNELGG